MLKYDEPLPDASTAELVREAIDEARELMKLEVSLARDEAKRELVGVKASAILLGTASALGVMGITLLLVALGLFIDLGPLPLVIMGAALVVIAAVAGLVGYKAIPRKPLADTRKRLETDVQMLKERTA